MSACAKHKVEPVKGYCAFAGCEVEALRAENAALKQALNPRDWTTAMNSAWHRAVPDMHKAFADLWAAAASPEGKE